MFIARVIAGHEASVHWLDDFELEFHNDEPRTLRRAPHSWRMTARGLIGAAAIDSTKRGAILRAKLRLERVLMERAAVRTRQQ